MLLSILVIIDTNVDTHFNPIKTKRCDKVTLSNCRNNHINSVHRKIHTLQEEPSAIHRNYVTMPLNQHIDQRATYDIRLTAHKHIFTIQIVTDRVKNLHNAQRSAWLKWRCRIETININCVWNADILGVDMFWQWKLDNNTVHIFPVIIFQYLIFQHIFGCLFRELNKLYFDSYLFTVTQFTANIGVGCRVVPCLINM